MRPRSSSPIPFLVLLLITTAACRRDGPPYPAEPDQPAARAATDAVTRFHADLAQERYADLCQQSESSAFAGSSDLPCPQFLTYVHDHLGNAVEAKRTQLPIVEDRRAGKPIRVGLDYVTHYERGEAREHFEWRVGGTQATLIGYRIEAQALSH